MTIERANAVTLMGARYTLVGPELKVGDPAPDFEVTGKDMKPRTLADLTGKARILSVIPSLDTPVCDAQTRRFNQEAAGLEGVSIYTVSMDLPFAQSRWCSTTGVAHVNMFSDHQSASFGTAYGALIKEMRLESRAIFILDRNNSIRYVEYVADVGHHPDYEAAMAALQDVLAD